MTTTWLPDIQKTFHLHVGLQPNDAEQESQYAGLVRNIGRSVDRLILTTLSQFEAPGAHEHRVVWDIMHAARLAGLRIAWGRNLWVAWPDLAKQVGNFTQHPYDVTNPEYFFDYIRHLEAERAALGAGSTFCDAEPSAQSIYTVGPKGVEFKRSGLKGERRSAVQAAIQQAVRQVGRVDFGYPCGGQFADHYPWSLRELWREYMHHSRTYFTDADVWANYKRIIDRTGSTDRFMQPPSGETIGMHYWGTYLRPSVTTAKAEPRGLTIADWHALPVREIIEYFPDLKRGGLWVSAATADRLAVLKELGE